MTRKDTCEKLINQLRVWKATGDYITFTFPGDVSACLEVVQGGAVALTKLYTPKKHRYKGYGRKALQKVCAWADKEGLTLELCASPYDGNKMHEKALRDWYSTFGFKMRRYKNVVNFADMYRRPKKT